MTRVLLTTDPDQLQRTLPQRSRQHHRQRLRPQRSIQQRRQRTSVRSLLRLVITHLAGGTVNAADAVEEASANKSPASPSAIKAFCMTRPSLSWWLTCPDDSTSSGSLPRLTCGDAIPQANAHPARSRRCSSRLGRSRPTSQRPSLLPPWLRGDDCPQRRGSPTVPGSKDMTEDLPTKNARLRHAVDQAAKKDPILMAAVYEIALKQPTTASPDEVQVNLQERAQAIIDLRPSLRDDFKGLLPGI